MIKPDKFYFLFTAIVSVGFYSSCSFSKKQTQRLFNNASKKSYDVIIVPGYPSSLGEWNDVVKIRVLWSKYLFDKKIAKNIVYSGSAVYSPYYESKVMKMYAEKLGIPSKNIYTETKAEHSTENIFYSYKMMKKLGFNSIAIATDPFQSKMMKKFVKKHFKNDLEMIPVVYEILKNISHDISSPNIDMKQAFKEDFTSLKERENFWKRLKGTRGKNINHNYYN